MIIYKVSVWDTTLGLPSDGARPIEEVYFTDKERAVKYQDANNQDVEIMAVLDDVFVIEGKRPETNFLM